MAWLFANAGYRVGIAHCNFGLRGAAADADEVLVGDLSDALDVPFYRTSFPTAEYARERGISIQMAAREMRYDWFETIRDTQGYDYIAIAQHQSDSTETVLLNLVRGTGLAGLGGIRPRRGRIIRPLLFLSGEEVAGAVQQLGLAYRDDESNFSTKYARNKLRLTVIPKLKELNPELERTFAANIARFSAAYDVLQQHVDALRERLFEPSGPSEWAISVAKLMELHPQQLLLFELFRPFHFSERILGDLTRALAGGMPGKQYESPTHVLHLDRNRLLLTPAGRQQTAPIHWAALQGDVQWANYRFKATLTDDTTIQPLPYTAQFDADKLIFPLQIRSWQPGDAFPPLGMMGTKKLSDFFVSLKIPRYKKQEIPLVINGNGDILWVVPYRISDRYKITGVTKKVLTLACN